MIASKPAHIIIVNGGKKMGKKFVLVLSVILLLVAGALTAYFITRRIPMDPSNHGNTPANLQNSGLFFEMDGKVFFSNANDNNCLYSMNPDETKPKRMTTMGVKYINGAEGYLYFYMDSTSKSGKVTGLGAASNQYGLYRCREDGQKLTCLHRDFCGEVQLCGEYLYYQVKTDGGSLHKIRCDKKELKKVNDEMISPVCYDNGIIYYTGLTTDHDIHVLNTTNDSTSTIYSGYMFYPTVQDGYLYYLNGDENYSIWRVNLSNGNNERITTDRCDCFTLNRQHIYYAFSNADAPALKMCDLDGANPVVLFNGVVNSLNLTSRYLYFKIFGGDNQLYHMPLDMSSAPEAFFVIDK